ncbi:MAG: DUF433 domain-containing protein [Candidatus Promineifilaceae bacterium]
MTTKTAYKHIVQTPDIAGGKPRIEGHRITIQNIVVWHEHMGYSVEEIADQYGLSLSEIYAALAYYFDHRTEIDRSISDSLEFAETLRSQTPSKLAQKLNERRN